MIHYSKKFTVERKDWNRGQEVGQLLNSSGKKCCLGFYALSCGLTEEEIQGENLLTSWLVCDHDVLFEMLDDLLGHQDKIIEVNDNPDLDDTEREMQLKELFARAGIQIKFV